MRAGPVAILMMAAGCSAAPPFGGAQASAHGDRSDICDAARAQSLLGQWASTALGSEAVRLSGAGKLRWIAQGAIITMDYSETRLNIQLDGQNKVVKISCG